jgi:predicted nucleic acid-binding protein
VNGPYLFDTSAESWLARESEGRLWLFSYASQHLVYVSAVTVTERLTGYGRAIDQAPPDRVPLITAMRDAYDQNPNRVLPVHQGVASAAAEILRLLPVPPSPATRTHGRMESKATRVARWRFDVMIAATALVWGLPLLHENARDFQAIRDATARHPERLPGLGDLVLIRCASLANVRR